MAAHTTTNAPTRDNSVRTGAGTPISALALDRMSPAEWRLRGLTRLVGPAPGPVPARIMDRFSDTGLVYVMQAGGPRAPIKVGYCHDWGLNERLKGLQTGNPEPLRVLVTAEGYLSTEQRAHAVLAPYRMTGEWFRWARPVSAFVKNMERGMEYAIAAAKIAQERTTP